ncbi:MAG: hypothetical protein M1501_00120 [Candidatus Omnitrophica bacterium]|nr:hypothetical protein [Candidatus Omnitrophota bacterium]
MDFFDYIKPAAYKIYREKNLDGGRYGVLTFPSPVVTDYPENNTVYVHFIIPQKPSPPVIHIHGLYEKKHSKHSFFVKKLSEQGFSTFLIELPFHMDRKPKGTFSGQLFLTMDEKRSDAAHRQAIIDTLALIDIIRGAPEFAALSCFSISAIGVSMGAIILNTLFAIDKRIDAGISILGAGNLEEIFIKSMMTFPFVFTAFLKGLRIRHIREINSDYKTFLQDIKEKGIENVKPKYTWFLLDPLTYTEGFRGRKFIMINAIFDMVIPGAQVRQFRKAIGKPEIFWLPCTHFTIGIFYKQIISIIKNFLRGEIKST